MLRRLTVQNYAIIDHLEIDFSGGLNIITGQTGAGKSILLGALGLIAGQKAEASVVRDGSDSCVVEAEFDVYGYGIEGVFEELGVDLPSRDFGNGSSHGSGSTVASMPIIVRRVISAAGRSRAFVDDMPVALTVLKDLCARLVDIHSQHQTMLLSDGDFQIRIVDAIAQDGDLLAKYGGVWNAWREAQRRLSQLEAQAAQAAKQRDYLAFQVQQLEELDVKVGEVAELEAEQRELANATEIVQGLAGAYSVFDEPEVGVLAGLRAAMVALQRVSKYHSLSEALYGRVDSAYIELRDVADSCAEMAERVEVNPRRLEVVDARLDAIYSLCLKHGVQNGDELVEIYNQMSEQLMALDGSHEELVQLHIQVDKLHERAGVLADELHVVRCSVVDGLQKHVVEVLGELGIKGAKFVVDVKRREGELCATGGDNVNFYFSGNASMAVQPLERVASGGEMSRLMLSIKSLVCKRLKLPTIIFDEIDTGVSGAVADKMGEIICGMGRDMQVINITHLPQVAVKGDTHFMVYKDDVRGTQIVRLDTAQRVEHIAQMLSGAEVTEAARVQAGVLLSSVAGSLQHSGVGTVAGSKRK